MGSTATTHRNGYADLKRSNPKLYRMIGNYSRMCWDQHDWAAMTSTGIQRANPKHLLNSRIKSALTLKTIERHCDHDQTIYYTSNPHTHYACLAIDIDDHDGTAGDSGDVFVLVNELFNGRLWGQPSTSGLGFHGYLTVYYPDLSSFEFVSNIITLETALQGIIHDSFNAKIEIIGTPAILDAHSHYLSCGQLCKIPRLAIDEWSDYLRFMSTVWTPEGLQSIIDRLCTHNISVICDDVKIGSTHNSIRDMWSDTNSPDNVKIGSTHNSIRDMGMDCRSPAQRMNRCGWTLSRHLGRPATQEEIWEEYHHRGLNTGTDHDGNRRQLSQESANWIRDNWNPKKTYDHSPFDTTEIVPLITQHITPDIRKRIKRINRNCLASWRTCDREVS